MLQYMLKFWTIKARTLWTVLISFVEDWIPISKG